MKNDAAQEFVSTYDAVPYPSYAYPQSRPQHLYLMGKLFGMQPPPVESARVLEIGCAAGGNIIPLAELWPKSTFLGVDASQVQIQDGQRALNVLKLPNIELRHARIEELSGSIGVFDYIICHGVYSWVSLSTRNAILKTCRDQLSPEGIAFISYNTYPGWHMRGMIRDMMNYHCAGFDEPQERTQQARALLQFLADASASADETHHRMLLDELALLSKSSDSYLFHEHLEQVNAPLYFQEFIRHASEFEMRYLSEVDLTAMLPENLPDAVRGALDRIAPDLIHLEQYLDFIRNRKFRRTLLCHESVALNRTLSASRIQDFYVASPLRPTDNLTHDVRAASNYNFEHPDGRSLTLNSPLEKAAFLCLAEHWPAAVQVSELASLAETKLSRLTLGARPEGWGDPRTLPDAILQCFVAGLVELTAHPSIFSPQPGSWPSTTRTAKYQAAAQDHVTNMRHEPVTLENDERNWIVNFQPTYGVQSPPEWRSIISALASRALILSSQPTPRFDQ
ncbi:MAG: methyltransferase regulatory domain-containing protein [Planctomycetales bacterium]